MAGGGVRTPRLWRRCRRLLNYLGSCLLVVWIATTLLLRESVIPVSFSSGSGSGPSSSSNLSEQPCATVIEHPAPPPYTVPARFEKYLADRPSASATGSSVSAGRNSSANESHPSSRNVLTVSDIASAISLANAAQVIHNELVFGPVDNSTIVIVVQVHSRAEYLKHLIVSFAAARDIEDALIVFSHDLFDAEINEVIERIDFCRYAQIFFPWSIQTHPDHFPGDDPRDCPPDMKRPAAEKLGCQNAKWPDKFGHYRQAKLSQIKHHWWWKAWYLFEGRFKALEDFTGDVIFLEEDHWVVEDFIPVYRLMRSQGRVHCPECAFVSLGNYVKKQDRAGNQRHPPQKEELRRNARAEEGAGPGRDLSAVSLPGVADLPPRHLQGEGAQGQRRLGRLQGQGPLPQLHVALLPGVFLVPT